MDIGRAFSFVFEDDSWVTKIIIAVVISLLSILIIPIPLLVGYQVAIARNVMKGDERLPEWQDWGKLWMDGLAIIVANIVYTLPFFLVFVIVAIPAMLGGNADENTLSALMSGTFILSCGLAFLWLVALLFIAPALVVIYARTDEWGALFRFGEVLSFTASCLGPIFMVLLVGVMVSIVVGVLSAVLNLIPCIGTLLALPLGVYPLMVMGHAYGQVGSECRSF